MKTVCFRCGCITGAAHRGVEAHRFLSYLMQCAAIGKPYTIYGYKGKQVRDNIHAADLVAAFDAYYQKPSFNGAVYNMGGGRASHTSLIEAARLCEQIAGRELAFKINATPRTGDHIWWISDTAKFEHDYPDWRITRIVPAILEEMYDTHRERAVSS